MTEPARQESELAAEFRQFMQNMKAALQAASEIPGRQQLQSDLQEGLENMRQSLNTMASDFAESETGQQLKSDLNDLGERVKSGELESQVRSELVSLLQRVNQELESAADRMAGPQEGGEEEV